MNYEEKAKLVPEVFREEIKMHVERISENTYSPSRTSVEILFKHFNQYINCTPSDIDCGDCRKAVFNFWKQQVTKWT